MGKVDFKSSGTDLLAGIQDASWHNCQPKLGSRKLMGKRKIHDFRISPHI